jgi:hypothetical protein
VLPYSLAWAEIYLILAALAQKFTLEPKDVTGTDLEMERDNFGIGTKAGCNLLAHVTLNETS